MTAVPNNGGNDINIDNIDVEIEQVLENTNLQSNPGMGFDRASNSQVNSILKGLLSKYGEPLNKESFARITVTVSHMCQVGVTSPKFAETRVFDDYGIPVKVLDLRAECKKTGTTVRKLARALRDRIILVAQRYNLEGNLAKVYKLENPNFDSQDLVWVADFQTFSKNPAMPEHVSQWLIKNYRNRFKPNLGSSQASPRKSPNGEE